MPCAACSTHTEEYRGHTHLNVCVCFCILKYVMYYEPMHFKYNKLYLQTAIKKGDISPISEISPYRVNILLSLGAVIEWSRSGGRVLGDLLRVGYGVVLCPSSTHIVFLRTLYSMFYVQQPCTVDLYQETV